jgi:hypothetical protein
LIATESPRCDQHPNPRKRNNENRFLFAFIGLAIGFALPTFAQQTNKPDPQLRERLIALIQKHGDAINKGDAAAVAANYTEDGVAVEQDGPTFGREAIQKLWADRFQKVQFSDLVDTLDEDSPSHYRYGW